LLELLSCMTIFASSRPDHVAMSSDAGRLADSETRTAGLSLCADKERQRGDGLISMMGQLLRCGHWQPAAEPGAATAAWLKLERDSSLPEINQTHINAGRQCRTGRWLTCGYLIKGGPAAAVHCRQSFPRLLNFFQLLRGMGEGWEGGFRGPRPALS
jgi:hypothetical protein